MVLAALQWSAPGHASNFLVPKITQVQIEVAALDPYKSVRAAARTDAQSGALTAVELVVDGTKISVPAAEFRDLASPDLHSLEILFSGDSRTEIYVYLEYGEPTDKGERKTVVFHVRDKVYVDATRMVNGA
jgi:hypothetical protein